VVHPVFFLGVLAIGTAYWIGKRSWSDSMDELDRRVLRFFGRVLRFFAIALLWLCFWPVLLPYVLIRWRLKDYRRRQAQREWDQRSAKEDEARLRQQRRAAEDGRRRVEARARSELLYNRHAPEIARRFPRKNMERFMQTYMSDADPAESVEQRGKELQNIIEQHRNCVKPDKPPQTIQDLAEWYLREKSQIDALPLDEELKQEHAAALDMRYAELTQELLQRIEP
jgi:hypothetical protein